MKILVTGATGFVGSFLVPELKKKGHVVYALGHSKEPQFVNVTGFKGNLTDKSFLGSLDLEPDVVIHLAALMLTDPRQKNDLFQLAEAGTKNLVHFCEKKKVRKIIFTSSTVALGVCSSQSDLINEDYQCKIPNWTDFANVKAKRIAEEIIVKSNLDWSIAYSGLIYGPRDWEKIIRKANKPILNGRMPFYFPGGVNINSIENFIAGISLILEKAPSHSRYILAGENITNKDFFSILAASNQKKPPRFLFPEGLLRFLGKMSSAFNKNSALNSESVEMLLAYHWCSSEKAQKELGYLPGCAESAINSSTKWILENHGL